MAFITINFAGKTEKIELTEDTYTIGRASDNDIIIEDKQCSRQHCEIISTPHGYKITDKESKNGTKINGVNINQQLLKNRDKIEVGRAVIIFEEDSGDATQEASVKEIEKLVLQRAVPTVPKVYPRGKIRMTKSSPSSPLSSFITVVTVFIVLIVVVLVVMQMNKEKQDPVKEIYEEAEKLRKEGKYADAVMRYELVMEKGRDTHYYKKAKDGIEMCKIYLANKSPDITTQNNIPRPARKDEVDFDEQKVKEVLESLKMEVNISLSNKDYVAAYLNIKEKFEIYSASLYADEFRKIMEEVINKAKEYISGLEVEAKKLVEEKKYKEAKKIYEEMLNIVERFEPLEVLKYKFERELNQIKELIKKLEEK